MTEETVRPETSDDSKEDTQTGAEIGGIGGAVAGAVAGSLAGPLGTIAGAVIGGIVGAVTSKAAVTVIDNISHDHSVTSPSDPAEPIPADAQDSPDAVPAAHEDT